MGQYVILSLQLLEKQIYKAPNKPNGPKHITKRSIPMHAPLPKF